MATLGSTTSYFYYASILILDLFLTLGNLVRFSRPVGQVTPHGHPGYGGHWPEYRPQKEGDSRCPCPGLNALANHGIISRSGRGIKFADIPGNIRATYNLSPTFCHFVSYWAARVLNKNYSKDTFDLEELDLHNGIEHDASLTRLDTSLQPNQSVVHPPCVEELFSFATGKDTTGNIHITLKDLSRIMGKRRAESKAMDKAYSLSLVHKLSSGAEATLIQTVFGGRVGDLKVILREERIPDGWESRIRQPYGLTTFSIGLTASRIASGIREAEWAVDANRAIGTTSKAV